MDNRLLIILGMTLVTYIPRLLPFAIVSTDKLPNGVRRFLNFIPYTALGALIIPGVFSSIPNSLPASIIGISFALLYSWHKGGIIVPVLGSIIVTYIILMFKI